MLRQNHEVKHLIAAVRGPICVAVLRNELQAAHDFLAEAAMQTARLLPDLERAMWGVRAKRTAVRLAGPRPARISEHVAEHSFAEIVNQCATLERLLDAMRWVETEGSGLRQHDVLLCNPTTSSSTQDDDHDLVLRGPDGDLAKFEVSDVAGAKDSNRKEIKDLCSLGCLSADGTDVSQWPKGRSFLVVSSEFATRLRGGKRHGLGRGAFHYFEFAIEGCDTRIFEIRCGMAS